MPSRSPARHSVRVSRRCPSAHLDDVGLEIKLLVDQRENLVHARTRGRLGRPAGLHRVHLVDSSVFPTVPPTTITYTVMANAQRIAAESDQA